MVQVRAAQRGAGRGGSRARLRRWPMLALALLPAGPATAAGHAVPLPPPLVLALARGGMTLPVPLLSGLAQGGESGQPQGAGGRDGPLAGQLSPVAAGGALAEASAAEADAANGAGTAPAPVRPGRSSGPPGEGPEAAAGVMRQVQGSRALGIGVVLAWGLAQWEYGEQPLHARSEGWFGPDTPEGGADKLGHLYTGYVVARGLAALYRDWGLDPDAAARQGALSSLLLTSVMELGDGFSPYGVSGEDMVMNLAGAWAGRALARHEAWRERVDLRVEYRFNRDAGDITTDYEHARYLVALKPAGFQPWRGTPLRWLELQAGYYARGYDTPQGQRRRTTYAGVGINLPLVLRQVGLERGGTLLQFYQPPDSSLRLEDRR